jgi:hypothetical protein
MEIEVHYRAHRTQPLDPVLSQMNPVHPKHVISLRISTSPPPPPIYAWYFPVRLSDKTFVCISHISHACLCIQYLILTELDRQVICIHPEDRKCNGFEIRTVQLRSETGKTSSAVNVCLHTKCCSWSQQCRQGSQTARPSLNLS